MLTAFTSLILFTTLAVLSVIDIRTQRLPDLLTLPLIAIGISANGLLFAAWWMALAGAVLGYTALVALELAYKRFRGRDGLGRGDAKLLAAGGAWCGAELLPFILLIGSTSALLYICADAAVRRRWPNSGQSLAFVPWLAFGIGLCWIYRVHSIGAI